MKSSYCGTSWGRSQSRLRSRTRSSRGANPNPSERPRGSWIEVVSVRGDRKRWTPLGLGMGEASLFETPKGDRLILDEIPARTVAEAEGRDYTGLLEKLARSSFRMNADLYGEVLRRLGDRA